MFKEMLINTHMNSFRHMLNLLEAKSSESEPSLSIQKLLKDKFSKDQDLKLNGRKIIVLVQLPEGENKSEFRKKQLEQIFNLLSVEMPKLDATLSTSSDNSSTGEIFIKDSGIIILVKDIGVQGKKSSGVANEFVIAGMIESVIQKYGTADITFRDERGIELEMKNADKVDPSGSKTTRGPGLKKKADIIIYSEDKQLPISLKQLDADKWESADASYGAKARKIIDKLVDEGVVQLNIDGNKKDGTPIYKLSKEIVIEPTREEAMGAIFGSDISPAGGIVIQTFEPDHYTQDEDKITIDCYCIIKSVEDIPASHLMFWLLRYNNSRNSKALGYPGIRVEAATAKRAFGKYGNKDVITVNSNGDVVDAKDVMALDKELDRIQQPEIDQRELRDKAKEITRGGGKTVDDIFAKKMDKEGVGREKR
tara:strand:+ start:1396 stop:2664 length:1269 start_codon:yes stop_codon:yes gene_type:complete